MGGGTTKTGMHGNLLQTSCVDVLVKLNTAARAPAPGGGLCVYFSKPEFRGLDTIVTST